MINLADCLELHTNLGNTNGRLKCLANLYIRRAVFLYLKYERCNIQDKVVGVCPVELKRIAAVHRKRLRQ